MATIGVGMLGYAFMGKAHSNAYRKISYITWPPLLEPKLVGIAGRNPEAVQEAADRYGFEYGTDDWRRLVADDSIGLFDNSGPNALHAEPTIAAAQAGKHVICEKPLGRDAAEGYSTSGRPWPPRASASVRLQLPVRAGHAAGARDPRRRRAGRDPPLPRPIPAGLGRRPSLDTWRFDREVAGSGALGDLMTHVVDLARFLNGELTSVQGFAHTFLAGRAVDDAAEAAVTFENGSVGTLEATRFAHGHRNGFQWEINGTTGALAFDLERLNEAPGLPRRRRPRVASGRSWYRRPITPSGSTGGRRATSSAGATPSFMSCTTS